MKTLLKAVHKLYIKGVQKMKTFSCIIDTINYRRQPMNKTKKLAQIFNQ